MPFASVRTGDLYYEEHGSGPPLVLLHANSHDHHDYDAVVPTLSQRYRTIAVDWPGSGESAPPDPPSSASAMLMADVLRDFVEALGLGPAMFIGNSVGGYAAARLALDDPARVAALVLINSGGFAPVNAAARAFCRLQGSERFARRFNHRFAQWYLRERNAPTLAILERIDAARRNPASVAVHAALWRSFPSPLHDLRTRAASITCPTLIVWGKRDPVARLSAGELAAATIPGARLVVLNTGHTVFAEAPEKFLAEVEPFLEGVARDASSNVAVASHG